MKSLKLCSFLLTAWTAFAGDMLPLQPGNYWVYREAGGTGTFTVRVGAPLGTANAVYYRLHGYVGQSIWVRYNDAGTLVYLDEEAEQDRVLTSFEAVTGGWSSAPLRPCEQETQVDPKGGEYAGPVGRFRNATALRYRSFGCGDTGVTAEKYLPSIGMVQREVTTLRGPSVYELAEARIGGMLFTASPAASFDVMITESGNTTPQKLKATLRLTTPLAEPTTIAYRDAQEYDLQLWNERGEQIYRWSDGLVFAVGSWERNVSGTIRFDIEFEPRGLVGGVLPDGQYMAEAWITGGPSRRAFAAMTSFRVQAGKIVR